MSDPITPSAKPTNIKKDLQKKLVQAVKTGDFSKADRMRKSLKNLK